MGGHVARLLAQRGAPRMVLAGRAGPAAPGAAALAAELASAGTAAEVTACDISDREQAAALLGRIAASGPALAGVMHAAGTGQSAAVGEVTAGDLSVVLGAKAAGAAHLDELTRDAGLERFVLFSSVSATWGSGLQPGYAAANAFLDALAGQRAARGLAASSVAWGPWGGGGMARGESGQQLARRGLRLMDPEQAAAALAAVLDSGETLVTVADVDWERFVPPFTVRRPSPLIAALPEAAAVLAAARDAAGPAGGSPLAAELAGLPAGEQARKLAALVRAETAAVLGYPGPGAVDPGLPFRDLGLDSLTAVELRNRLAAATGLRLPATLVFDYPTPDALAACCWPSWPAPPGGAPGAPRPRPRPASRWRSWGWAAGSPAG